jgi:glycerol-3-phosphate acyltransferase PlsY
VIFSQYFFFIAVGVGVGCYLIGAIPISYLLGRFWAKIDIRTHGSRNVGASNLAVNGGKNIGIIAGVMDCLIKGTFTVLFLDVILGMDPYFLLIASISLVAGHNWSIFIGLEGGRGIATAFGLLIGFQMWEEILVLTVFLGIIGRLILYKDSGVWCFISFGLLPLLCFAFQEQTHIIIFSVLLGVMLISKRLMSNGDIIRKGSVKSTLLCRLVFDRDILSKTSWLERG